MLIRVSDNNLYMNGIIFSGDDRYFDHYFSALEKRYDEIKLHVHTAGGSVFAGNYIENKIRTSKAKTIFVITGTAFSMGAIIMTAADEREIVGNGFVMIHAPQGVTRGTAQDHLNNAQLLTDMQSNFVASLIAITGKKENQVKKWLIGDNYFNAKRALSEGLVDRIIAPLINIKVDETKALDQIDVYGQFSALLVPKSEREKSNTINTNEMNKQNLIDKFSLTGVTADSSDTAIENAIQAKLDDSKKKFETEKAKNEDLESAIATQRDAKIEAVLKPLEGKLPKEKIDTYRSIGKTSGVEALETVLEGVAPRKTIVDVIDNSTSVDVKADFDWDKYQKEDPRGLEKLAKDNPEAYLALGKAKFGENWTA